MPVVSAQNSPHRTVASWGNDYTTVRETQESRPELFQHLARDSVSNTRAAGKILLIGRTQTNFDLSHLTLRNGSTRQITIMLAGFSFTSMTDRVSVEHDGNRHIGYTHKSNASHESAVIVMRDLESTPGPALSLRTIAKLPKCDSVIVY